MSVQRSAIVLRLFYVFARILTMPELNAENIRSFADETIDLVALVGGESFIARVGLVDLARELMRRLLRRGWVSTR